MRTRTSIRDCVAERCERLLVNAVLALLVRTYAPPSGRGFVCYKPYFSHKFNSFHRLRRSPVSLRLGHARGLTSIQDVIQHPRAASLPPEVEALHPPQMRETGTFHLRQSPHAFCVPCTHTSALLVFAYTSCGEFRRFCGWGTPMKPLSVAARTIRPHPHQAIKLQVFCFFVTFLAKQESEYNLRRRRRHKFGGTNSAAPNPFFENFL